MKHVEILLTNPLGKKQYAAERIVNFGNNLAENLNADFPEWAGWVRRDVDALQTELGQQERAATDQTSETGDVDTFIAEIPRILSAARARVAVDLGDGSHAFKAIYPDGMATYNNLTKTSAPIVLKALQDALDKHATNLEPQTKQRLHTLYDRWMDIRDEQERAKEDTDSERAEVRIARENLEWTIVEVLHRLALHFGRNVEQAQRYVNSELLDAPRHARLERSAEVAGN